MLLFLLFSSTVLVVIHQIHVGLGGDAADLGMLFWR